MEFTSSCTAEICPPIPSVDQLTLGENVMIDEYTLLKEQLEKLISSQQTRESNCTKAQNDLKSQYDSIIQTAKNEASKIVEVAQSEAIKIVEVATSEAETITTNSAVSVKAAEQKVLNASTEASTIIATAQNKAAEIVKLADDKGKNSIEASTKASDKITQQVTKERGLWEKEKATVADIQKFEPIVKVNVGGNRFDTSLSTLTRYPSTMIGTMFSGRHTLVLDAEGYHFIDRDGTHFRYILNFLRSPETFEVDLPSAALKELQNESNYYGLNKLMFPFKPMAPFTMTDTRKKDVIVKQGSNGLYSIDDVTVTYCGGCGIGSFSTSLSYTSSYVKRFVKTVKSKGGVIYTSQPTLNECPYC